MLLAGRSAWVQAQPSANTAPPPAPTASSAAQRIEIEAPSLSSTEQRRLSLQMMTVIDRDELDEFGDSSVLDVLQRQPGIGIDGEQPRLRGMGAGYTLILLNGEPAPPGFSLDQLSPADIERIEVIKGPSAEYGGVAGTINVILRSPPKLRQREWRSQLTYRSARPAGSVNVSWGDRVQGLGFQLPLSAYQWAGANRSQVDRLTRTPDLQMRQQTVQGRDQWHGGGINMGPRLEWKLSEDQTLVWQSFLQRHETGNANQRRIDTVAGPPASIGDEWTGSNGVWQLLRSQLQWARRWADGLRIELKASAQDSRGQSTSRYNGLTGPSSPLVRDSTSSSREQRLASGMKLRVPWSEAHVLVTGVEAEQRERTELRTVTENGVDQHTMSVGIPFDANMRRQVLFVQDEWSASTQLAVLLGVRAERVSTVATDAAAGGAEVAQKAWVIAPMAQARWALGDKGRDLLRVSLARSSRLPDLSSLMGRYVQNTTYDGGVQNTPIAADSAGNPRLMPERSVSSTIALESYLRGGGVLSLSMFHTRIDDLIRRRISLEVVSDAVVPRWVSRPANFGRATSRGLSVEVKGRGDELLPLLYDKRSPWTLRASASGYRSKVEQVDDPDSRLEGQAPWQATLGFDRSPRGGVFSFGASITCTPAFATQQTDLQRVWRSAVQRLDAYALWRFDRDLQLRLSVQNALPADSRTANSVEDLDGFAARSLTVRPNQTQFNASLLVRF